MEWNIDSTQKWVTLIAAMFAAIASGLNLWWKFREKTDKIKVAWGLIYPQIVPGEFLTVVSLCDHQMQIADYGYVMPTGRLLSLPQLDADEPDDDPRIIYGSLCLGVRNSTFETGITLRDRNVGVYAMTTSQTRHTIAFRYDSPGWIRIWIRLRLLTIGLR